MSPALGKPYTRQPPNQAHPRLTHPTPLADHPSPHQPNPSHPRLDAPPPAATPASLSACSASPALTGFPTEPPPLTPFPEPDPNFSFDPDLGLFASFGPGVATNGLGPAPVEVVDPGLVLKAEDGHKLAVVLAR